MGVLPFLLQPGLEPAEGALALDGPRQPPPGSLVADLIGEVGHILVPGIGRQRADADEIQIIEINGVLAVDSGVRCGLITTLSEPRPGPCRCCR